MNSATALPRSVPATASLRETAGLMVAAAATPLLVHLLPSWDAAPLGAHLLPMFWTAFVAVYLFGPKTGALAAVAGPGVSLLLTGAPALARLSTMTAELLVFVALAAWASRRWTRLWLVAPLSYLAAKVLVTLGLVAFGAQIGSLAETLTSGLAGVGILAAINFAFVRSSRRAS